MILTWLLGKVFLLIAKRWAPDMLRYEEENDGNVQRSEDARESTS